MALHIGETPMTEMIERVAMAIWKRNSIGASFEDVKKYMPQEYDGYAGDAKAAIKTHTEALKEAGYVIVPRDATEEMLNIFADINNTRAKAAEIYKAMINAALEEDSE